MKRRNLISVLTLAILIVLVACQSQRSLPVAGGTDSSGGNGLKGTSAEVQAEADQLKTHLKIAFHRIELLLQQKAASHDPRDLGLARPLLEKIVTPSQQSPSTVQDLIDRVQIHPIEGDCLTADGNRDGGIDEKGDMCLSLSRLSRYTDENIISQTLALGAHEVMHLRQMEIYSPENYHRHRHEMEDEAQSLQKWFTKRPDIVLPHSEQFEGKRRILKLAARQAGAVSTTNCLMMSPLIDAITPVRDDENRHTLWLGPEWPEAVERELKRLDGTRDNSCAHLENHDPLEEKAHIVFITEILKFEDGIEKLIERLNQFEKPDAEPARLDDETLRYRLQNFSTLKLLRSPTQPLKNLHFNCNLASESSKDRLSFAVPLSNLRRKSLARRFADVDLKIRATETELRPDDVSVEVEMSLNGTFEKTPDTLVLNRPGSAFAVLRPYAVETFTVQFRLRGKNTLDTLHCSLIPIQSGWSFPWN